MSGQVVPIRPESALTGRFSVSGHAEVPAIGGVRDGDSLQCPRCQQRGGKLGEDRQVHVEPDPDETPHPQRQRAPLVLEPAELPLDRAALVVPGPSTGECRAGSGCAAGRP
jgi:hypothetical protein